MPDKIPPLSFNTYQLQAHIQPICLHPINKQMDRIKSTSYVFSSNNLFHITIEETYTSRLHHNLNIYQKGLRHKPKVLKWIATSQTLIWTTKKVFESWTKLYLTFLLRELATIPWSTGNDVIELKTMEKYTIIDVGQVWCGSDVLDCWEKLQESGINLQPHASVSYRETCSDFIGSITHGNSCLWKTSLKVLYMN